MTAYHEPVMVQEVLTGLLWRPDGLYVDGTLGGGGHARAILESSNAKVVGLDVDPDAIHESEMNLVHYGDRIVFVNQNFKYIPEVILRLGYTKVDGILLDLGVSSYQLDRPEKGFTFGADTHLDSRLDPTLPLTAKEIVNTYSKADLQNIFSDYGEERFSGRIASSIVRFRLEHPIERSSTLVEIISKAIPAGQPVKKSVARIFQAIRIEINKELEVLETLLGQSLNILNTGGRLVVISYHSLEDRQVKSFLKENSKSCECPPGLPVCVCGRQPAIRVLSKKAIKPSPDELARNPRSRSARLRIAERMPS